MLSAAIVLRQCVLLLAIRPLALKLMTSILTFCIVCHALLALCSAQWLGVHVVSEIDDQRWHILDVVIGVFEVGSLRIGECAIDTGNEIEGFYQK
jgi:hypothetical protein